MSSTILTIGGPAHREALRCEPDHLDALAYQGPLFPMLGDMASVEANLATLAGI